MKRFLLLIGGVLTLTSFTTECMAATCTMWNYKGQANKSPAVKASVYRNGDTIVQVTLYTHWRYDNRDRNSTIIVKDRKEQKDCKDNYHGQDITNSAKRGVSATADCLAKARSTVCAVRGKMFAGTLKDTDVYIDDSASVKATAADLNNFAINLP